MTSTARIGWVLYIIVATGLVIWHCGYKGLDFVEGLLIYGFSLGVIKGWEKFLGYKYGVSDAGQSSSSPVQ